MATIGYFKDFCQPPFYVGFLRSDVLICPASELIDQHCDNHILEDETADQNERHKEYRCDGTFAAARAGYEEWTRYRLGPRFAGEDLRDKCLPVRMRA